MEALHVSRLDLLGTNRFYKEDSSLRDYFEIGAFAYDGIFVIDLPEIPKPKRGQTESTGCMCRKRHRGWRTAAVGRTLWAIYSKLSIISGMMPISNTIRIRILAGARYGSRRERINPKTSVKEDNWGTSFILNRYSSIYGGFRGSNLPYYESWIESV